MKKTSAIAFTCSLWVLFYTVTTNILIRWGYDHSIIVSVDIFFLVCIFRGAWGFDTLTRRVARLEKDSS